VSLICQFAEAEVCDFLLRVSVSRLMFCKIPYLNVWCLKSDWIRSLLDRILVIAKVKILSRLKHARLNCLVHTLSFVCYSAVRNSFGNRMIALDCLMHAQLWYSLLWSLVSDCQWLGCSRLLSHCCWLIVWLVDTVISHCKKSTGYWKLSVLVWDMQSSRSQIFSFFLQLVEIWQPYVHCF